MYSFYVEISILQYYNILWSSGDNSWTKMLSINDSNMFFIDSLQSYLLTLYLFVNKLEESENMPDLRECWNGCEFIATSVPDMPPNYNLYVSSFATCALSQRSQYTSVHFYKFVSDDMWFSFCLLVASLFCGKAPIKSVTKSSGWIKKIYNNTTESYLQKKASICAKPW